MKKIVLTERQLKMVKKNINESLENDRYERVVSVNVDNIGIKFRGEEIDWITCRDIRVTFLIEQEHRKWGIKNISVHSVEGPSEIELTITPQVDDAEDVQITVPINWENVNLEKQEGEGVVTIADEITIKINNNENGDIIVESINVPIYSL